MRSSRRIWRPSRRWWGDWKVEERDGISQQCDETGRVYGHESGWKCKSSRSSGEKPRAVVTNTAGMTPVTLLKSQEHMRSTIKKYGIEEILQLAKLSTWLMFAFNSGIRIKELWELEGQTWGHSHVCQVNMKKHFWLMQLLQIANLALFRL